MDNDLYRFQDGVTTSSCFPFPITPHATNEIDPLPKAIYVGTGGDIVLRGVRGVVDVTFKNVPSGAILDIRAQYIRAAGTTAANLVGLA